MTRKNDEALHDEAVRSEARARQAKGSVQEAIGKITGNIGIEQRGHSESQAGARQAKADHSVDGLPVDRTPIDRDSND